MPPPPATIRLELPQYIVNVSGFVLHPESYRVDMSKVQDFTCEVTVLDVDFLPPPVRDLFKQWEESKFETLPKGLWVQMFGSTIPPGAQAPCIVKIRVLATKWLSAETMAKL
jgi:hypothetical protein